MSISRYSLFAILLHFSLLAAPASMQLKWSELSAATKGQPVIVDLTDGSSVNATIYSVEPAALALHVTSNSHSKFKKGQASVPRETIARLRLIRMHIRGRIIGTSVGAVAGLFAGGMVVGRSTCSFYCGALYNQHDQYRRPSRRLRHHGSRPRRRLLSRGTNGSPSHYDHHPPALVDRFDTS